MSEPMYHASVERRWGEYLMRFRTAECESTAKIATETLAEREDIPDAYRWQNESDVLFIETDYALNELINWLKNDGFRIYGST